MDPGFPPAPVSSPLRFITSIEREARAGRLDLFSLVHYSLSPTPFFPHCFVFFWQERFPQIPRDTGGVPLQKTGTFAAATSSFLF